MLCVCFALRHFLCTCCKHNLYAAITLIVCSECMCVCDCKNSLDPPNKKVEYPSFSSYEHRQSRIELQPRYLWLSEPTTKILELTGGKGASHEMRERNEMRGPRADSLCNSHVNVGHNRNGFNTKYQLE